MSTSNSIRHAVRYALLTSAAATVAAALPAQAAENTISEVVVTGSRIPQPNLTSISPVTSVSAETIKIEGVTRAEDLINNLPQAFADFGGNLSNGATGAATVNLRNLGSQRTLVLVNNRRLMPGDPTQNGNASADINQIPASLIERVEVLTGGASAVYGADAVAGVVNFIMNDNFEGVRVDAQYSFYQHNNDGGVKDIIAGRQAVNPSQFQVPDSDVMDGYTRDITFTMGVNSSDGKGNITGYLGYRTLDALAQNSRDFSGCPLNSGATFTCGGSGTASPARIQPLNQATFTPVSDFVVAANGSLIPYSAARDAYNFAPTNYYQRPDERYTAGLFGHYEFSDKAEVYTELMFMDDKTVAQIAPSGAFLGGYIVNCANPLLSAQQVTEICTNRGLTAGDDAFVNIGKRNVEGGGRRDALEHTAYRGVIGLRGDITDGWTYDVYGLYGTTLFQENYTNDFSFSRLAKALTVTGTAANPTCRVNTNADLADDDPACVPYNIFTNNSVDPAALNYLQIPGFQQGSTKEIVVSGSIAADLGRYGLKLPTASDGIGIAFGSEYRSEESELRADAAFQSGDLAGQGAATLNTAGGYDVRELFAEARIPLLQDKPFAQSASMELGYRYSDYSLGFNTDTYKIGLDWAPIESFRLRGTYQRAVRAPNVQELFLPQKVQLDGNTDPCASTVLGGPTTGGALASAANCARTGVTAAQYGQILANSAAQYNGLTGGNPTLDPETADTYSYGFVFTPTFLPNFSAAIDYFDIKVDNQIAGVGADLALNQCLATGDSFFCGLIHRGAGGTLWLDNAGYVTDTTLNTGSQTTKGVDLDLSYRLAAGGLGSFNFNLIGTYVDEFVTEPLPGLQDYDCKGLYGTTCGTPVPEWRHKARVTWSSPWNADVTLTWRYIASVDLDKTSSNPNLNGAVVATDRTLGKRDYFDLTGSYQLELGPMKTTLRVGINNIFDRDPPLIGQSNLPGVFGNGNTFPQVYDSLGRYGFVGLQADF
jgi:iron complex outermembrane receptor protein